MAKKKLVKPTPVKPIVQKADKKDNSIWDFSNIKWEKEAFYTDCEIDDGKVKSSGLEWQHLAAIFDDHTSHISKFNDTAKYIAERIRTFKSVHSVRYRIKSASSLIRKIIRKNHDDSKGININNYKLLITDLVGVRALHLYKDEWININVPILSEWDIFEKPTAYYRKGDDEEWIKTFTDNGCYAKEHKRKYRSVHYIVKTSASKETILSEIQVRTIFEEGWSEIDHRINYPVEAPDTIKFFLGIFNRFAGSADEMGSFIKHLAADLKHIEAEKLKIEVERDESVSRMEDLIKQLDHGSDERKKLEQEIENLKSRQKQYDTYSGGLTGALKSTLLSNLGNTYSEALKTTYGDVLLSRSMITCNSCGSAYLADPNSLIISGANLCPSCSLTNSITIATNSK
ncbi:MAG: hypothetical protein HQ562_04240 [Candidatus Marinimicrobia bacterium]|nr:hypothetical protein [Candidatus Neomarinimicrobiota bacterium]